MPNNSRQVNYPDKESLLELVRHMMLISRGDLSDKHEPERFIQDNPWANQFVGAGYAGGIVVQEIPTPSGSKEWQDERLLVIEVRSAAGRQELWFEEQPDGSYNSLSGSVLWAQQATSELPS